MDLEILKNVTELLKNSISRKSDTKSKLSDNNLQKVTKKAPIFVGSNKQGQK